MHGGVTDIALGLNDRVTATDITTYAGATAWYTVGLHYTCDASAPYVDAAERHGARAYCSERAV